MRSKADLDRLTSMANTQRNRMDSQVKRKIAVLLAMGILTIGAHAAEVTHFSHSVIIQNETTYQPVYSDSTNRYIDTRFGSGASDASLDQANSFGLQRAVAKASLSQAELKAGAWAEQMTLGSGSRVGLNSIVAMADSFSLVNADGSPFSVAGSQATFSLDVSGQGSVERGGAWQAPTARATLELFILSPGSIDRWKPNAFGGFPIHVEDIVQVFQWGATPWTTEALDYSTWGTTYAMHSIPMLNDGDVALAEFEATTAFDWLVRLGVNASLFSGDPAAYAYSDFSHTVGMSFEGPDGSVTQSASGVFPGTVAISTGGSTVPEPSTLLLVLPALFLALRRLSKNETTAASSE